MQDAFAAYWNHVSSYFSNNQYVIGYDPINEPYPSNYNVDPSLVTIAGKFDHDLLQPLYTRLFQHYKNNSKQQIMFYEPG
jgi:endoglycosylceramidase